MAKDNKHSQYKNIHEHLLFSPDANDRTPPSVFEYEQFVLGGLLIHENYITEYFDKIKPSLFYDHRHQYIYNSMVRLFTAGSPINILTVANDLKDHGELDKAGTPHYISTLTSMVGSYTQMDHYILVLKEYFMRRAIITSATLEAKDSYDVTKDIFDVFDKRSRHHEEIIDAIVREDAATPENMGKELKEWLFEGLLHREKDDGVVYGIPSGLHEVDDTTNGWQDTNLIVVGARPGMGKTAFLLTCAYNCIKILRKPVVIFSLEMSKEELMQRFFAMYSGISIKDQGRGDFDSKWAYSVDEWIKQTFYDDDGNPLLIIDDSSSQNINDTIARAKRYKRIYRPVLYLYDYLQLGVKGLYDQERQEISFMCKSMKGFAKEAKVPWIVLSQLNRKVEDEGKSNLCRPMLKHLRESGTIEEDADIVLFLYRQEYYWKTFKEEAYREVDLQNGEPPVSCEGIAEIVFAKYRNSDVGSKFVRFVGHATMFKNLEEV